MFELKKTEGLARRGIFHTVHGDIETPFFMNVGTAAAIKGAVSSIDLTRVELCNTYHLHLRQKITFFLNSFFERKKQNKRNN